ncbi:hypothetical protein JQK87_00925 [Streptomyces sp. G44]|uniref:hypothetical protein n=1 Tax=Streptomyces sp. G44 TaxID=2807632 RepID=UPI0019605DC3|nr:hypothetical protein [Streptomyces sp. G44]MBM7167009.1 hypothetical protein [Streptomyces sp. G44]
MADPSSFELSADGSGGRPLTDHRVLVRVGSLTARVSDRDARRPPRLPLDGVVGRQLDRIGRALRGRRLASRSTYACVAE